MIKIGIIVALTNFSLLLFISNKRITNNVSKIKCIISLSAMLASFIYHLSEIQNGIPGIYYLNKYSPELLIVDRFFAILSFIIMLNFFMNKKISFVLRRNIMCWGLLGLICLFLSEGDVILKPLNIHVKINCLQFLFFHSLWHFIAFECLSFAI